MTEIDENPGTQYLIYGRRHCRKACRKARLARVEAPAVAHHVMQRGKRRQQVFFEDAD